MRRVFAESVVALVVSVWRQMSEYVIMPSPAPPGPIPGASCESIPVARTNTPPLPTGVGDVLLCSPPEARAEVELLTVFLPGTGATCLFYSDLLQVSAASSWTLCAAYDNTVSIFKQCEGAPNVAVCEEEKRSLGFNGADGAILPRAAAYIKYIATSRPKSIALSKLADQVSRGDWTNVVVAGHSQGAGYAAFFAFKEEVKGLQFSGPCDHSSWYKNPHLTASRNFIGFGQDGDEICDINTQEEFWQGEGVVGPVRKILRGDLQNFTLGNDQKIVSFFRPCPLEISHNEIARCPYYTPVWRQMFEYVLSERRWEIYELII